jgi:predicted RNA-binding Zn-ribbon protein involved in translation (DUF1610 family)
MSQTFPPPGFIPTPSTLPGIEVYMPAPKEAAPKAEVVDFKCPQCGAITAFRPADGGVTCAHCNYWQPPALGVVGRQAEKFEFTVETLQRAAHGWGAQRKDLACQNCGALTSVPPENLTHTCPFCNSNKVIQREAPLDILQPRFVIPFKFETARCAEIARPRLGNSWMTPKSLGSAAALAHYTGVYLPFWTFSAATQAVWKAEVGHQEQERYYENGEWKTRTVTRWRWESGNVRLKIEDLLVEGAQRLSALLMGQIKDYDLADLAPYEPTYLAGMQAQAYDTPLETAWEDGRQQMREKTRQACLSQASTSQVRNFSMQVDFRDESWRYILLPVYLNTYQYGDKTYQMMINGQTGAIAGQRPVDWNKVWLVIAMLLAPGLFLGLIGLLTAAFGIGLGIGGLGFVLLMIGLVISIIFLVQAQGMDKA